MDASSEPGMTCPLMVLRHLSLERVVARESVHEKLKGCMSALLRG